MLTCILNRPGFLIIITKKSSSMIGFAVGLRPLPFRKMAVMTRWKHLWEARNSMHPLMWRWGPTVVSMYLNMAADGLLKTRMRDFPGWTTVPPKQSLWLVLLQANLQPEPKLLPVNMIR